MENQNNNFINNQSPLSSGGDNQGAPVLQKAKEPKLRWKTGLLVLFFSFYYFGIAYLIYDIKDIIMDFDYEDVYYYLGFSIIPSVVVFLIYIFTAYRAEKVASDNKLTWRWIIRYNLLLSTIIYVPTLLVMFFILALSSAFGDPGSDDRFMRTIVESIWTIGLIIVIFSIIPTVILKQYRNSKKFIPVLLIFFAAAFFLSAGYKYINEQTCNFGENIECFEDRAEANNDFEICEKIENEKVRNGCYYGVAYENNNIQACEEIDIKYNAGNNEHPYRYSRDDCYYQVFLGWDLEDKTLCYNISNQIFRNSCLVSVAGNTGDSFICQSGELNETEKQKCMDEIARSSAFLKKDPALCENIKSASAGASTRDYCYWDIVVEAGVKEAKICEKIENESLNFRCFSYVASKLKDMSICDNLKISQRRKECVSRVMDSD